MMMMKSAILGAALIASATISSNAQAASEDECAIWICLPGAFPATCEAAKSAMIDRVEDLKPPLPPFSACSADGTDHGMSSNHGVAAYIPPRRECVRRNHSSNRNECIRWENKPERYVKGTSCQTHPKENTRSPKGCSRTVRYVEVFDANGDQQGDTYYW
ncbi:MAG: conjugal transfer protein TraL [Pseudomonadota bacterium]